MTGTRGLTDRKKASNSVVNAMHWDDHETRVWLAVQFTGLIALYGSRCFIVITIVPMAEEFGWNERQCGIVLSAFYWGYIVTQIIGGNLSDRFGGDRIQWVAAVVWSLATLTTLYVARVSIWPLVLARFLTGMAQGVHFPALCSLIAHKVPEHSRTKFYGISNAGAHSGAMSVGFIGSLIIRWYRWQALVVITGCGCLLWTVCIRSYSTSHQKKMHYRLSDGLQSPPATGLKLNVQPSTFIGTCRNVPWRELLLNSSVIAYLCAYVAECSYVYIIPSWAPTFFNEVFPNRTSSAWLYNGAPPLIIAVGAYSGGLIVNHLIVQKYDVTVVRKVASCVCLFLPGICLIVIGLFSRGDSSYPFTLIVFLLSSYFYGFAPSAISVNCMDLAPAYTGSLYGMANTLGSIPGMFAVPLIGYILDTTSSWALVFLLQTAILFTGCVIFLLYGSGVRLQLSTVAGK